MSSDWIRRIAEDERERDTVRLRGVEVVARKADLVRVHGRRLVDELRATVERDIDEFRHEFPGDPAREILFEGAQPEGGFTVQRPQSPSAFLSVMPHLNQAAVMCRYQFTPSDGMPVREDRLELTFSGEGDAALQIRLHGTGQVFASADTLSEFLLSPVFTGRPR